MVKEMRSAMEEDIKTELGEDEFDSVRREYDDAFTLALHKDVRKEIIEQKSSA